MCKSYRILLIFVRRGQSIILFIRLLA